MTVYDRPGFFVQSLVRGSRGFSAGSPALRNLSVRACELPKVTLLVSPYTEDLVKRRIFIATALASALAPVALSAQKPVPPPSFKAEKCYGIAKAAKNDCASWSCFGSGCARGMRCMIDRDSLIFPKLYAAHA